jgi:hypothetical protein
MAGLELKMSGTFANNDPSATTLNAHVTFP